MGEMTKTIEYTCVVPVDGSVVGSDHYRICEDEVSELFDEKFAPECVPQGNDYFVRDEVGAITGTEIVFSCTGTLRTYDDAAFKGLYKELNRSLVRKQTARTRDLLKKIRYGGGADDSERAAKRVLNFYKGRVMPDELADSVEEMAHSDDYKIYAKRLVNGLSIYLGSGKVDRVEEALMVIDWELDSEDRSRAAKILINHYLGRVMPEELEEKVIYLADDDEDAKTYARSLVNNIEQILTRNDIDKTKRALQLIGDLLEEKDNTRVSQAVLKHYQKRMIPEGIFDIVLQHIEPNPAARYSRRLIYNLKQTMRRGDNEAVINTLRQIRQISFMDYKYRKEAVKAVYEHYCEGAGRYMDRQIYRATREMFTIGDLLPVPVPCSKLRSFTY